MRNNQILALFADVNNLYHGGIKKYNRRLDYKLFIEEAKQHGRIQVAYAYGVAEDQGVESFKALLRHTGYECRWNAAKYNWNVGIAMDVVRQLDKVDLIILGSGDAYLAPCAEYVKQQGIKCYAYGFKISPQMREAVDRYFEITENLLIQDE
jgi:uncharacterized LabA/DUF88 family protein